MCVQVLTRLLQVVLDPSSSRPTMTNVAPPELRYRYPNIDSLFCTMTRIQRIQAHHRCTCIRTHEQTLSLSPSLSHSPSLSFSLPLSNLHARTHARTAGARRERRGGWSRGRPSHGSAARAHKRENDVGWVWCRCLHHTTHARPPARTHTHTHAHARTRTHTRACARTHTGAAPDQPFNTGRRAPAAGPSPRPRPPPQAGRGRAASGRPRH